MLFLPYQSRCSHQSKKAQSFQVLLKNINTCTCARSHADKHTLIRAYIHSFERACTHAHIYTQSSTKIATQLQADACNGCPKIIALLATLPPRHTQEYTALAETGASTLQHPVTWTKMKEVKKPETVCAMSQ